jgi:chaperone required for assembly of F1-ATPase
MKRFYKSVTLGEKTANGYGLFLDGKPVRTPARQDFVIPTEELADIIVSEWSAQGEEIIPNSMPVSQMTMTLTDRVIPHRQALADEILGYIDTDLICYRADEPEPYKRAQEEKWNPFVKWFEDKFQTSLLTTSGLAPLTQSQDVHRVIREHIESLNDHQFMAAYIATLGMGSIILAIAFETKSFGGEDVLKAAFAEEMAKDEIYLGHIYGSAPDQEKKYNSLKSDLDTLQHFI